MFRWLTLASLVFVIFASSVADAGPFRRHRKAKTSQQSPCATGHCPRTVAPGSPLTINHNGGFEGQLTNQQFLALTEPPPEPTAKEEHSIIVKKTSASSIQQAKEALQEARGAMLIAQTQLEQAIAEQERQQKIQAIELDAQIKKLRIRQQAEIDALKQQQSKLLEKKERGDQ